VAFSPNGNIIASGSGDRTVKLWDIQTSSNILTLDLPDGVVSVALSHQYIAAGSLDNSVMIWDFSNGTLVKRLDGADGHRNSVYSVAFSPDGKSLISGSWDKTIKMWDLTTPRGGSNSSVVDRQLVKTFEGHSVSIVGPDYLRGIS
jgi:glucose repression regulatory protein TUP1